MTPNRSSITSDMTAVEAANRLEMLGQGHQAAWLATHEVPWHSAEHQSRFQNAVDVDDVFRDLMWETVENGIRRPGEPVEEFAERADSQARLADTRDAAPGATTGLITLEAGGGVTPGYAADSQDDIEVRLLDDPSTPEGQAYTRAVSDSAAAHVRRLRQRHPLPEPDRTLGAPHPDPFLASRGWHANEHGICTRRTGTEHQPPPERELEPGA